VNSGRSWPPIRLTAPEKSRFVVVHPVPGQLAVDGSAGGALLGAFVQVCSC
jgi:hypothetical protein